MTSHRAKKVQSARMPCMYKVINQLVIRSDGDHTHKWADHRPGGLQVDPTQSENKAAAHQMSTSGS